ncbi:LPS-assembly protein LptD [Halotalea alkalilenta]|uniref:LPS-assembly protein LptD n=1 Tax=Halotalea alkalilenta TaxID=376489 RepID=UPI00047F193C|nr:LPS-assembly protein LptD [Halotalea alkalilenta]
MAQRTLWTAASLTSLFYTLLPAATPALAAPPLPSLPADQLDWHAWGDDRPSNELCSGYYLMPDYELEAASDPEQVRGQSDDAGYGQGGITTLTGNVVLRQQDQQLQARQATLNEARDRVSLEGPITYRQPNVLVRGEQGSVSLNSDAADIEGAHYVFHSSHARGDASRVERLADGRYRMRNATFTTCDPQSSLWKLQGNEIVINREEGYGTASGTRLRLYDVPVFYWPWLRFPIDDRRLSGLLYPTVGFNSDNGFDYAQPIYLNLAPNYDATIVPRYMSDRGVMLGGQFRYLFGTDRGQVEGNYLPSDDGGSDGRNDDFYDEDRWFFNYMHDGRFSDRLTYSLRYGAASDGDYFDDFGTNFDEQNRDNLERLANLDYRGDVWHLRARARGYQVMDYPVSPNDKPFYELPSLSADARWTQSSGTYQEWNSSATYFYRDIDESRLNNPTETATGARLNIAPAIGFRRDPSWGFFEPRAQLFLTQYDLSWENLSGNDYVAPGATDDWDESPHRTIPVFSVDSGLIFERHTSLFGSRWRQTLEPRLYYAYVPYRDQSQLPQFDTALQAPSYAQLWSPFRFNGIDRIGDVNKVSYGVSSRFLDDATGHQRFTASVGQSRFFDDRRVTDDDPTKYDEYQNVNSRYGYDLVRDYSPAIGQLEWQINDRWSTRYALFYDTENGATERNETYVSYRHPSGSLLNLGYRWQREGFDPSGDEEDRLGYNRNEYDVSFAWRMNASMSLVGRYLYDQTNSRSLETLAGVQFNDCCYGIEVAWREYVDDDDTLNTIRDDETKRGLFLRFIFKGLGGVGQNPDTYFEQAVPGYQRAGF